MELIKIVTAKYFNKSDEIKIIGKGGAGTVVYDTTYPEYAFKISHKQTICRIWEHEQKIYIHAMGKLNERINFNNFAYAKLLTMYAYYTENSICTLMLNRISNPNYTSTIHALIGQEDVNYREKKRGQMLGLKQITDLLTQKRLNKCVKQIGHLIGMLHYIAKIDCYDIEVWLAYENGKYVFYIGDFDQCQLITSYDESTKNRMVWALDAVNYFPTKENTSLYKIFSDAYLELAEHEGMSIIAKEILDKYDD